MSKITLSNIINVSVSEAPAGVSAYNVNNIALFTGETPVVAVAAQGYEIYKEPTSVITQWGSTSEMALQANAVFAQSPNILSGGGSLIGIPLLALLDSAGTFTTPDLEDNIDNFAAVDAGSFSIDIDGAGPAQITAMDFSLATTLTLIAAVIDSALTGATASISGNTIIITSDSVGASSSIVIVAPSGGTDITTATLLNIASAVTVDGFAARTELIQEAIVRTKDLVYYTGILATQSLDAEMAALVLATYIQALGDKIIFYPSHDTAQLNSGSLFDLIRGANDDKTRCLLHTLGAQDSRIMAAAYASRAMGVNFSAANSTNTIHMKDLNGITGDTGINNTLLALATTKGVDTYPVMESVAKVFSTGGNEFFDNVFNLIWFVLQIQVIGFNAIATTSTKLPQTEAGMEVIKGAYRAVCNSAINNRFVGPGTWTSGDTFGDVEDFIRNIAEIGFYIYATPVNQQSTSEREAREASVVQIAIKYQGAIHSSDVIVFVNK